MKTTIFYSLFRTTGRLCDVRVWDGEGGNAVPHQEVRRSGASTAGPNGYSRMLYLLSLNLRAFRCPFSTTSPTFPLSIPFSMLVLACSGSWFPLHIIHPLQFNLSPCFLLCLPLLPISSNLTRSAHGRGVRLMGTDAWSWDAPFVYTAQRYKDTGGELKDQTKTASGSLRLCTSSPEAHMGIFAFVM